MKIKCKHCESFLGNIETGIVEIYCKNCGSTNQIIVLDNEASIKQLNFKFTEKEKPPRASWLKKQK